MSGLVHASRSDAGGSRKNATIYVVNRLSMGKFDSNADHIYQELVGQIRGPMFGAPAYFNNSVYFGAVGDSIRAFSVTNAVLSGTPTSQTSNAFVTTSGFLSAAAVAM